jgi:hypothetical protein
VLGGPPPRQAARPKTPILDDDMVIRPQMTSSKGNRAMLRKTLFGVIVLAVAAGGPAVFYGVPDAYNAVRRQWSSAWGSSGAQTPATDPLPQQSAAQTAAVPPDGVPLQGMAEVFRFDVTTGWILHRWPRVSTGLAELPLQGYRVPLVTGTAQGDLAGSLTYYFNPQQQIERITFQGVTGDARELVTLLTDRYDFTRRLTNDPGLFVYEVPRPGKEPVSVLKIRSVPVVTATEPHGRFKVDLVIQRPQA